MMSKFMNLFVLAAVACSLAFVSGCRNPNTADQYPDDGGLIIGDPLMGDVPLGSIDGLPADGDRTVVDPVYFAYDSSTVNSEEAAKVEKVASLLNRNKWKGVIVEGHTDERGSREYNLALGERRALAVRDYLISLGVDPSKVQTKSYGEEMPDDMGHDESAWRNNRRAVFAMY